MDFSQDYFQIFGLDRSFELDLATLDTRYRELQKTVHPDRFADATDQEKRLSAQWATQVNTAYDILKKPLPRAIYLLQLKDIEIEHNPTLDPMFLMEQIELREALEELEEAGGPIEALDDFKASVQSVMTELNGEFAAAWNASDDAGAEQVVYRMQFMNKLLVAADHAEEKILDY